MKPFSLGFLFGLTFILIYRSRYKAKPLPVSIELK